MTDITPTDITLAQLHDLKVSASGQISAILNRFAAQTGLTINAIDVDKLDTVGAAARYAIHLDVQL
jgi:hypothetical protein